MSSPNPWSIVAALTAFACSPVFDPASKIERMQLLAIRADPPEIAPASAGGPDGAALTALVADPSHLVDPTHQAMVLYFACTPDPRAAEADACLSFESLRDPGLLATQPGVSFLGLEACDVSGCSPVPPAPFYRLPADLDLADLPPGAPARVLGMVVSLRAIAVDAPWQELLDAGGANVDLDRLPALLATRGHVDAIKRLPVRGPDAVDPPNQNPELLGIARSGDPGRWTFAAGGGADLTPLRDAGALPSFHKLDAQGRVIEETTEDWVFSWFSTAGALSNLHTRGVDPERWTAPDEALPGTVRFWLVARDLRGGTAWVVRDATRLEQ